MNIAIIPLRNATKRIKKKNTKFFLSKPIIDALFNCGSDKTFELIKESSMISPTDRLEKIYD